MKLWGSGDGSGAEKIWAVNVLVRRIVPGGRLRLPVADDQSARGQVAQPLVLAGDEHGDHADDVETGKLIDKPDQVAGHGFEETDGAAGTLDHSDPGDFLARCMPVPECLKESEVAPVEQKQSQQHDGDHPLVRKPRECPYGRVYEPEEQNEDGQARSPDQHIDQQGNEPASDAGQRHLDGHQFRSFDAKLI